MWGTVLTLLQRPSQFHPPATDGAKKHCLIRLLSTCFFPEPRTPYGSNAISHSPDPVVYRSHRSQRKTVPSLTRFCLLCPPTTETETWQCLLLHMFWKPTHNPYAAIAGSCVVLAMTAHLVARHAYCGNWHCAISTSVHLFTSSSRPWRCDISMYLVPEN